MKIFIDTSSLIKLYHTEIGTDYLDEILEEFPITEIYLSEITKVEFNSAIWKKVRTKELTTTEAQGIIDSFVIDYEKYTCLEINSELINNSRDLISKYGINGLRTLDSIQFASILKVKDKISFVVTSDELLKSFAKLERIDTK